MSSTVKTKGRIADKLSMGLVLLSTSLSIILLLDPVIASQSAGYMKNSLR